MTFVRLYIYTTVTLTQTYTLLKLYEILLVHTAAMVLITKYDVASARFTTCVSDYYILKIYYIIHIIISKYHVPMLRINYNVIILMTVYVLWFTTPHKVCFTATSCVVLIKPHCDRTLLFRYHR